MDERETIELLALVRARYPTAKLWDHEAKLTVQSWRMTLVDVSAGDVQAATLSWFRDESWPPDPAELRKRVRQTQRDRERAERDTATLGHYRALSDGWMSRARQSTATNEEITQHVVGLADAWRTGDLDLAGVRGLCSGYERFVALNHDKAAIMDLIEALAADDDMRCGHVVTKHGMFTPVDIRANGGILSSLNGVPTLRWPSSGYAGRWRYGETT